MGIGHIQKNRRTMEPIQGKKIRLRRFSGQPGKKEHQKVSACSTFIFAEDTLKAFSVSSPTASSEMK